MSHGPLLRNHLLIGRDYTSLSVGWVLQNQQERVSHPSLSQAVDVGFRCAVKHVTIENRHVNLERLRFGSDVNIRSHVISKSL
jgi:hypothetical protein